MCDIFRMKFHAFALLKNYITALDSMQVSIYDWNDLNKAFVKIKLKRYGFGNVVGSLLEITLENKLIKLCNKIKTKYYLVKVNKSK